MSTIEVTKVSTNVGTQTNLHVAPYSFNYSPVVPKLTKQIATEIHIKPDEDIRKYLSVLKYTGLRLINRNAEKVIILNSNKDVYKSIALNRFRFSLFLPNIRDIALSDDDGISDMCSELLSIYSHLSPIKWVNLVYFNSTWTHISKTLWIILFPVYIQSTINNNYAFETTLMILTDASLFFTLAQNL